MDDHSTPQTVKDPQEMIAGMSPVMQPGLFVFCSILYNADSREAMAQAHGMIIEDEGMSLILPRAEAVRLGLAFDQPLKQITLMV